MKSRLLLAILVLALPLVGAVTVRALSPAAARQAILDHFAAEARKTDPGFKGFSAAAGKAFFLAHPPHSRPATPSCSYCHTTNVHNWGKTRAGKRIAPMAVSLSPQRFSRMSKVARWFFRNCRSVYGRVCTPVEKGNFITYMMSQ